MFRIGILGAENSHAMAFTRLFNGPEHQDEFADIKVVGVGGDYPEANREVFEKGGLEILAERPEDLLGKIDAIMVTARDGRYHARFARPFIEAGMPAFIDKPFTSDPAEALALARLAKARGVPLAGGSLLKMADGVNALRAYRMEHEAEVCGGNFTAPVSMENEYGNFWFYSAHLVEANMRIFGMPEWVWADRHAGGVTAVAHYANYDVTHHFTEGAYLYSGTVNTKKETFHQPVDIGNGYLLECRAFAKMLRTGEMESTYEDLVRPVFYIAALERAFETGERQEIPAVIV